jgi:16S rRNA (guanine527-N7)-methyltransferase
MKTALLSGLPALGLRLSDTQADTFCRFGEALLEKNQVMNLTAITDPQEVARLHFLDCMALLNVVDFRNKAVVDVGCGAGFPGVPLKIAEPSIQLTLLDSLKKRVDWLSETLPQLGLEATCVAARAEEYALQHRECYDLAVSRAVARLSMLSELCLPLVSVGGAFVAMKSVDSDEEISQAARGIGLLGGRVEKILDYPVPGTDTVHRAVVIRKVKKTPGQYPRRFAKIKQSPL